MRPVKSLFLYICVLPVVTGDIKMKLHEHGDDGNDEIDPFDMLNFDPSNIVSATNKVIKGVVDKVVTTEYTTTAKPPTTVAYTETATHSPATKEDQQPTAPPESSHCSKNSSPYKFLFKNYVQQLLNLFNGKVTNEAAEDFKIAVTLSKSDVETLSKFTSGETEGAHDAHEVLTGMLQMFSPGSSTTHSDKLSQWLENKFGVHLSTVVQILTVTVLVMITIIVAAHVKMTLSWKQFLTKAIIFSFFISIPMTWYELYKAAEIEQHTAAIKDIPDDCRNRRDEESNIMEDTIGYLRSLFTFKEDNCQKYFEHMHIHPILRVPPTKAVSVTFARFFLSPMRDIGTGFSEFLRALLKDLPVTLYPIAVVMVTVFLFLFLFMWMGYSIRLPFFLSIEPGQTTVTGDDSGTKEAIETSNKNMEQQMKTLMIAMEERDQRLEDKIQYLEKVQMSAIEYTVAQQAIPVAPPTLPSKHGSDIVTQKAITQSDNTHSDASATDMKSSESWSILDPVEKTSSDNVQTIGGVKDN